MSINYKNLSLKEITEAWIRKNFNIDKERQSMLRNHSIVMDDISSIFEYSTGVELEVEEFFDKVQNWVTINIDKYAANYPEINWGDVTVFLSYFPSEIDYGFDYDDCECEDSRLDIRVKYTEYETDKEVIKRLKNRCKARVRSERKKEEKLKENKLKEEQDYKEYLRLKEKFKEGEK